MYLQEHHNISTTEPTISPKIIVLHYTAGGTLQSNFKYFNSETIEDKRTFNKNQSTLNVSAHYLVDRDGTVYQLMPDTMFARHTIGLNYCAIGVENIGSKTEPLTEAQVKANALLVQHLCKKYSIAYLIGHSEYGIFKKSSLWRESNAKYFTGKEDPGASFMTKVRALLTALKLKSRP